MHYQELNLLVIFDVIMTEASVTKASERLNMTQPAVSNAVARMRHIWNDELFVRDGRNISPTIFAQRLWENTRRPMADIRKALSPSNFEAINSDRVFNIAAIDSFAGLIWPKLRMMIENEAPNIKIHTYPFEFSDAERILNDAKVEILITASNLMPQLTTSHYLGDLEYVSVMKSNHAMARSKMSINDFACVEHLLVAPSGDIQCFCGQTLAELGLKYKIGFSVNSFSNVSSILEQSNLICTVPSIYVEDSLLTGNLVAQKTPFKIPNTRMCMYWHKRSDNDKGVTWLRKNIEQLMKQRINQHNIYMAQHLEAEQSH